MRSIQGPLESAGGLGRVNGDVGGQDVIVQVSTRREESRLKPVMAKNQKDKQQQAIRMVMLLYRDCLSVRQPWEKDKAGAGWSVGWCVGGAVVDVAV